jgi:hypothetical protein
VVYTVYRKFTVDGSMEKWGHDIPSGLKSNGEGGLIYPADHERVNVAGNNKTHFGHHVKYPIRTKFY